MVLWNNKQYLYCIWLYFPHLYLLSSLTVSTTKPQYRCLLVLFALMCVNRRVQYLNILPKQEQGINWLELSSSSEQATPPVDI